MTTVSTFKKTILTYYRNNGRNLPWRNIDNPYDIVVSELMLQQTQVARVIQKYPYFIKKFPTFESLAKASLNDILKVWSGMGYNRRAKYLQQIAQVVIRKFKGKLPEDPNILISFPGIGKNTAGSICAFAFNKPTIFIETNIRRVFIHFFFHDKENIDDKQLLPLIEKTMDSKNPREWYYALMDYGVYLAKSIINPNRKSKHYTPQSKFKGSNREVRGAIIKGLIEHRMWNVEDIYKLPFEKVRINKALESLAQEGFIMEKKGHYSIK